jgi:hypothetical protein
VRGEDIQAIRTLLHASIVKMRYPAHYNFDRQNDAEIEFSDYRANLKILFDNIAKFVSILRLGTSCFPALKLQNSESLNLNLPWFLLRPRSSIGPIICSCRFVFFAR